MQTLMRITIATQLREEEKREADLCESARKPE